MRKFYTATNPFKTFALLFSFLVFAFFANAGTITSVVAGGSWTTNATWVGGVQPVAGDDVIINGPVTIPNATTLSCFNLQINDGNSLTLSNNRNFTANGTVTIQGNGNINLNTSALVYATTKILVYIGTTAKSVAGEWPATSGPTTVIVNNTAGVTLTAARTINNLSIGTATTGIFSDGGFQLTASGTFTFTSGIFNIGTGTGNTSYPGFGTSNIAAGTTVNYNSTSNQTIAAVNYGNLASVTAPRILKNGGIIGIQNTFTPGGGAYTITNSTVSFNGTLPQSIPAFTFNSLTIDNTAGISSIGGNVTVNQSLALTNGVLTTGANTIIIPNGGSAGRTNGWINGNLQQYIASTSAVVLHVGGATYYSPVTVNYTTIGFTAGYIKVKATAGLHPQIATSGLNSAKAVNRYWNLTSAGVGGTYDATFGFDASDVLGGANTANFVIREYNSPNWATTVTGIKTATSTQATGLSGYGDFSIGEISGVPTVSTQPTNVAVCLGNNISITSASTSTPTPTVAWERFDGSSWVPVNAATDGGKYTNFTISTLTITAPSFSMNGYQYRVTYTNINGAITSSVATLTVTQAPTITLLDYPTAPFANTTSTPQTVTLTGTNAYTGGTYSSDAGLTINSTTGAITPSTSTLGLHTVTYTIIAAGGCGQVTATTQVNVTSAPTANIAYTKYAFCITDNATYPATLTGTGNYNNGGAGFYSVSPASGLLINSSTGAITPNGIAGPYTITYHIPATTSPNFPASTTDVSVTITPTPTATISYAGGTFCSTDQAAKPVIFSGTTGGVYSSDAGLIIDAVTGAITPNGSSSGSHTITYTIAAAGGCSVVTATAGISIVLSPAVTFTYNNGNPLCLAKTPTLPTVTPATSGTYSYIGTGLTLNTSTGEITPSTSSPGDYDVTLTISLGSPCGDIQITKTVSIVETPSGDITYALQPYCTSDPIKPVAYVSPTGLFTGGTFSSSAGLTINASTGAITPGSSTANTYTVIYNAPNACPVSATTPVEVDGSPTATISYAGSPFCITDGSKEPVSFSPGDNTTGTFSAPSGLSIDPTFGNITPSTSTAGTYIVTYTIVPASANCAPITKTTSVTITPAVGVPTAITISGGTEPTCQLTNGTTTTNYATTVTNGTGFNWSLSNGAAGLINPTTGQMAWANGFSGTVDIKVTANGCNGLSAQVTRTVNVTPAVTTPVFTLGATSTRCQGAGTITYDAAATNTTGITYTLDNASLVGLNTISATTGDVTFVAGWSGTSVITASAAGCSGPLTATHTVTVTATVGTPVFTLGATSIRCQGAATVAYGAAATDNTGITYTLDATTLAFVGNSIVATTGAVTYATGWNGTSVVTASAVGCNGPKTAIHTVTITPTVTINLFSPATSTRCQGAGSVTTTTTATNSTGITYSLDATTAAFIGNSINSSTGAVTYAAGWSGNTTITASASGCNGPAKTTFLVTTYATSAGGTLSPGNPLTVCYNSNTGTITLNPGTYTGTAQDWEKSTDGGATWSNIGNNGNTSLSYTNLTVTTLYRVQVKNSVCSIAYSSVAQIVVNPVFTPTISPASAITCVGVPVTLTASGYSSSGQVITGGDFGSANPPGWSGYAAGSSNGEDNKGWGFAANSNTWNGQIYNSDGKFAIVAGTGTPGNTNLLTPVFSLVGLPAAYLALNQAYNLSAGASASIQISINGGATFTTLQTYTGSGTPPGVIYGPTNGFHATDYFNLNAYLGLTNLVIRFAYTGVAGSDWALDNIFVTNTTTGNPFGIGVYNTINYVWSPATELSATNTQSVILTPTTSGIKTYFVTASTSGCTPSSPVSVSVTVNDLAQGTLTANGPFCGTGAGKLTFTASAGTGPFTIIYNDGTANRTVNNVVSGTPFNVFTTPVVATTTYTLVSVTDTKTCSRTSGFTGASATITVNALPTVTVAASPVCGGEPSTITAIPGGPGTYSYVWTVPATATNPGNIASFTSTVTGNYSVVITNTSTGCVSVASVPKSVTAVSNTWTGVSSTSWQDIGNWSCAAVPTAITDVIIPTAAPNMPTLNAPSFSRSLELQGSAVITLNGQILNNVGGITLTGTGLGSFIGSPTSSISINAPATSSTINFSQLTDGTSNALNNLTVDGAGISVTLDTKTIIYGALTPTLGTLNINSELVLRSTSTTTARVGQVGGTIAYSGTGIVTVERYFPPTRNWRMFTAPVSGGGSIYDNWQNGGLMSNVAPGKGTLVTGRAAPSPLNGFDGPSPNLYTSLEEGVGNGQLNAVLSTHTENISYSTITSAANKPFFIFVRGDRNLANFSTSSSSPTTLSSKGKLQTGTQTFTADPSVGSFTMIGNPYASPVDFSGVTKYGGLGTSLYVWDPTLALTGAYVTFLDFGGGVYQPVPSTYAGVASTIIQSGQSFYVSNPTGPGASLIFNESNKSNTNNPAMFNRPMSPAAQIKSLSTNLYAFTNKDSIFLADGNLAQFDDSYNPGVDWQDAKKMTNTNETFSLLCNGVALAADRRPLPSMNDTLFYHLTRTTAKKYQFQLIANNLDRDNLAGFLQDQFMHTATPINLNGTTKFNFVITSNKASAAADRFRVVFKPSVVYTNVAANVLASDIGVQWNVASEENIKGYEIERSTDGTHFTKVADQASAGNSESAVAYNWLDVAPALGQYYYRIRSISYNDVIGYSNIVKVKLNRSTPAIYVFPNPVTENAIHLQMNGMEKGVYAARLMNNLGQVVMSNYIAHMGGTATETLRPANRLLAGIYQLEIAAPDKKITTIKVIVQYNNQ
jgi:hypothetical protein